MTTTLEKNGLSSVTRTLIWKTNHEHLGWLFVAARKICTNPGRRLPLRTAAKNKKGPLGNYAAEHWGSWSTYLRRVSHSGIHLQPNQCSGCSGLPVSMRKFACLNPMLHRSPEQPFGMVYGPFDRIHVYVLCCSVPMCVCVRAHGCARFVHQNAPCPQECRLKHEGGRCTSAWAFKITCCNVICSQILLWYECQQGLHCEILFGKKMRKLRSFQSFILHLVCLVICARLVPAVLGSERFACWKGERGEMIPQKTCEVNRALLSSLVYLVLFASMFGSILPTLLFMARDIYVFLECLGAWSWEQGIRSTMSIELLTNRNLRWCCPVNNSGSEAVSTSFSVLKLVSQAHNTRQFAPWICKGDQIQAGEWTKAHNSVSTPLMPELQESSSHHAREPTHHSLCGRVDIGGWACYEAQLQPAHLEMQQCSQWLWGLDQPEGNEKVLHLLAGMAFWGATPLLAGMVYSGYVVDAPPISCNLRFKLR